MAYSIVSYVIHEHKADRAGIHWDFRMQIPNKNLLASFALPKSQFPKKPGDKVLAVRTNDHGRYWLYMNNTTIPKGEYGAGTIKIIQDGKAEILGWSNTHITFKIKGRKVSGRYSLIKFKPKRAEGNVDTWFLVKTKKQ
jgi:bifunctional non-homologous end joining protein LigD